MHKGTHLLVDCSGVEREVCLDDARFLDVMADACRRAGSTVISQVRYRFGETSPPGFTAVVVVDESHCSAHSYADLGLVAMDLFTCGDTNPRHILDYVRAEIPLGQVSVREIQRFVIPAQSPEGAATASSARA